MYKDMGSSQSSVATKFLSCDIETNIEDKQIELGSNPSKLF